MKIAISFRQRHTPMLSTEKRLLICLHWSWHWTQRHNSPYVAGDDTDPVHREEGHRHHLRMKPGKDLMIKGFLTYPKVVNIITDSLVETTDAFLFETDGTRSDMVLEPKNAFSNLPPLFVEVQHTVSKSFIKRAVNYCCKRIWDIGFLTFQDLLMKNLKTLSTSRIHR